MAKEFVARLVQMLKQMLRLLRREAKPEVAH